MKLITRILFIILTFAFSMHASDLLAQSKQVRKAEVKAEKKKVEQKKALEIAKNKDVKRRFEMQTPATRDRMKKSRKDAKRLNDQGHEPFLKRMFHRKRK
jgi:hypothetical protein